MTKLYFSIFALLAISPLFNAAKASAQNSSPWNLNDVSYLYPLTQNLAETEEILLTPQSSSGKGPLLPVEAFSQLPSLNSAGSGQQEMYDQQLKVVGVRIDPCPQDHGNGTCLPEVRLVWQPVIQDKFSHMVTSTDLAVHTFYHLTPPEFLALMKELKSLKVEMEAAKVSTHQKPLGPHPAFLNSKTRVPFAKSLNKTLTTYCGQQNLYKVTFMSLLTMNVWWRFGGFTLNSNNEWQAVSIPRLNLTFQDIFNSAVEENPPILNPGKGMDAVFNILPPDYPESDDLHPVINKGFRANDDSDRPVFLDKISAVDRFRNPLLTNSGNLDCASCHFADATRFYINDRFADLKTVSSKDAFKNPNSKLYSLENRTLVGRGTRVIRAFGLFGAEPAISQRTINESAEIAEWLNRKGL